MKFTTLLLSLIVGILGFSQLTHAQEMVGEIPLEIVEPGAVIPQSFYKAKVIEITDNQTWEGQSASSDRTYPTRSQDARLEILNGDEKGKIIETHTVDIPTNESIWLEKDEVVVVAKTQTPQLTSYNVVDKYRLPALWFIIAIFIACAIFFGRWHGFTSLIGLAFTILVLLKFIVPQIIAGRNALLITLIGSIVIAIFSIYLAHGLNKRITIAVMSTLITLVIAITAAYIFITISRLFGLGSQEAIYIQAGYSGIINMKGLLLGGIIIGTLGVLDDITTSQVAALDEIQKANPNQSKKTLYKAGISIGKEHIASLVNTLVLAYAGAGLPLFLLFVLNTSQPAWVTLNSEFIAEEIVRTLVGSVALILAVPISTLLAINLLNKDMSIKSYLKFR
jgi:uncharacterized membrane protein